MFGASKFYFLLFCFFLLAFSCRHSTKRHAENLDNLSSDDQCEGMVTIIGSPNESDYDNEDILLPIVDDHLESQILTRLSYIVSYNKNTKCPNWVAWRLTAEHADGKFSRDNNYYEDESVPFPRATNDDYKGSEWTRGHMCPAGDNKWDRIAMRESNLLTNICPQHSSLNSGLWNVIERDCRKWALKYGDIFIVCGPLFYNDKHQTVGINEIVVPEAFFKVILCLAGKPKAIGFVIKNNDGKKKKDQYVNTIDEVERITGMDFFSALPDSIENEVEVSVNIEEWK